MSAFLADALMNAMAVSTVARSTVASLYGCRHLACCRPTRSSRNETINHC